MSLIILGWATRLRLPPRVRGWPGFLPISPYSPKNCHPEPPSVDGEGFGRAVRMQPALSEAEGRFFWRANKIRTLGVHPYGNQPQERGKYRSFGHSH